MINKERSNLKNITLALTFCTIFVPFLSCNDQNRSGNETAKHSDTGARKKKGANAGNTTLTLPILDALFFEEGFEDDLRTKLQLTEQQVQKLKALANTSVADLSEDGADYGSARAATKYFEEQVKNTIGQEKADQLFELINDRYASGAVQGLFPTQPNAIATDTRIVVNAPAYRMDVFQAGKLIKTYRIGIGYPEFPLPTGMRRAENIIFNPTWTPPDEPWVKGKVEAGKKVAAGDKLNPLGPIKIPIGSPSLIHGGKSASKLGSFASHGCVGMTNAQVQDFTMLLSQLGETPITADSITGIAKNKTKTKTVKLSKEVPVELRYETIVVENGSLHIYRDVYERGTNTIENATSVLAIYGVKLESLNAQEKQAIMLGLDSMNRDPKGEPIIAIGSSTTTNSTDNDSTNGVAASKVERAKKGKVTTRVVGQKEIIIPIASLQGKGYPAPVNLDIIAQKQR